MPSSKVFTFDDPLPYQLAIYTADVELIPTTRGQFFGELTQVRLQMQRYFMSLPQIHIVANRSGRTAFAAPRYGLVAGGGRGEYSRRSPSAVSG
jgi:hypothetical protein